MDEKVNSVPNPGSPAAVSLGCTCATMDNYHGLGFAYGEDRVCFYITADCPMHGGVSYEDDEEA